MTPKILAEPNNLWWFVPAAAVIGLLYFLSPILAPFLFAAILAYISNPVVTWLAQHRVRRALGAVLAEFLRGQIAVMVLMSVLYVLGLWLAGLEFALPIGIITGMLVFVPYVGMLTGLALATLAGLMQFPGVSGVIPVWIVFGIGQALEGMLVTPLLVGQRIGLHPVAVIFTLLAFGQIFGFFGILLALPASAALLVGLRHLGSQYSDSSLYKK